MPPHRWVLPGSSMPVQRGSAGTSTSCSLNPHTLPQAADLNMPCCCPLLPPPHQAHRSVPSSPVHCSPRSPRQVYPEASEAMKPFLTAFGNPSSAHAYGAPTAAAVATARAQVRRPGAATLAQISWRLSPWPTTAQRSVSLNWSESRRRPSPLLSAGGGDGGG